jgi:hypothetical protein
MRSAMRDSASSGVCLYLNVSSCPGGAGGGALPFGTFTAGAAFFAAAAGGADATGAAAAVGAAPPSAAGAFFA